MRVLSIERTNQHGVLFSRLGHEVVCTTARGADVGEFDLVLLGGGADVDPSLYGQEKAPRTHTDPEQDALVMSYLARADLAGIPVVGICKGAQQMCVYDDGTLDQHVDGHSGAHNITIADTGEQIYTVGNHHQMMVPSDDAEVLAYAENLSGSIMFEPEVVYFPNMNGLGFQYHPEWMDEHSQGVQYFHKLIEELLL